MSDNSPHEPLFHEANEYYYLSEGSHVEIRSEEEGLQNSWLPATVLESSRPLGFSFPTRRTKANTTATVRYKHMISGDTGELLVETLMAMSIRPVPPEDPKPLGPVDLYEVVDAFHEDVWWTGYVARRDVDDDMYVVACENPPDVLRVRRSDLRLHWDWVHNPTRWVRPHKKKGLKAYPWFFKPATEIEQDYDEEKLGTSWKPAIYVGKSRWGLHFIKFSYEGKCFEASSSHIRPRPPKMEREDFEWAEIVEAFCDPLWTVGVVTEVLEEKRYIVALEFENKEAEFDHSQLRPSLDWANGQWVSETSLKTPESGQKLKRTRDLNKSIAIGDDADSVKKRAVIRDENGLLSCEETECVVVRNGDESLNDDDGEPVEDILIGSDEESTTEDSSMGNDDKLVVKSIAIIDDNESLTKHVAVGNESLMKVNKSGVIEQTPFVKCSSIWRYLVETDDVYNRFPQSPDFLALTNCDADKREGLAVGHMVNFSNLVRRISNLQRSDTPECVESLKERLVEYEHVGFEVKEIQGILDEWLGKKMEWEESERLMWEKTSRTAVMEEELEKINERRVILMMDLKKLGEREAILIKEKEGLGSEIASLKEEAELLLESGKELLNFFPCSADEMKNGKPGFIYK